jgi:hypothetical protein
VLGPHYKHRKQIVPKLPELKLVHEDQNIIEQKQLELKKKNIPWARLLARVFNIDEDPKVIRKILKHMGLNTRALMLSLLFANRFLKKKGQIE